LSSIFTDGRMALSADKVFCKNVKYFTVFRLSIVRELRYPITVMRKGVVRNVETIFQKRKVLLEK
jgi:hypothetical protein